MSMKEYSSSSEIHSNNGEACQILRRKPKLLFIAYCFPPMPVIGSVRAGNIAKYLSCLGWDVLVVCPDPKICNDWYSNGQAIIQKLEASGVHIVPTRHRWQFMSPGYLKCPKSSFLKLAGRVCRRINRAFCGDEIVGWYSLAEKACKTLQPDDVDVILATGSPWGDFSLARNIANRLQKPYCLDYRDLWTMNPYHRKQYNKRSHRLEMSLLADSAAVITISPQTGRCLMELPSVEEKLHVVFNGYDPNDYCDIKSATFDDFAIVYAGQFYPPKQSPTPLFRALSLYDSRSNQKNWRFHYYGFNNDYVADEAKKAGIFDKVVFHGYVSHNESLGAVRGANLAFVVSSIYDQGTSADLGIVTGKVFDAIGQGTPILAVAPLGSDLEHVISTSGRGKTFCGSNIEGMAVYLGELMAGKAPPVNRPEEYSWPVLASKYDSILKQVIHAPLK